MRNSIRHQLMIMFRKKEFSIAFCVTLAFSMVAFFEAVSTCWGVDDYKVLSSESMAVINSWFPMWPFFQYIYVFLIVIPYSMAYLNDKECEIESVILTRESRENYYISMMVACFVGNMIIYFVPFLVNWGLCCLAFGRSENAVFGAYETWGYYQTLTGTNFAHPTLYGELPLLKLYVFSPELYTFIYIMFGALVSGLFGVFVLCCSMWGIKSRAFLFAPLYILWLISSVASEYSYTQASISDSYYTNYNFLDYLAANGEIGQNLYYFGGIILIMVTFCLLTFRRMIRTDILGLWEYREDGRIKRGKNC